MGIFGITILIYVVVMVTKGSQTGKFGDVFGGLGTSVNGQC